MPKSKVEVPERLYQFYAASNRLLRAYMEKGDVKERRRVMAHRRAFMGVRAAWAYLEDSVTDEQIRAMEKRLAREDRLIRKALKGVAPIDKTRPN